MKSLLILILLMADLDVAWGDPSSGKFDLQFPTKDHLTARQLYQRGYPTQAIDKIIGQFVLLDVVVRIEREVPLVEIEIPEEVARDAKSPLAAIQAHLISATSLASSRKKGERLRIEGLIVAEGYGAYTIYLHKFQVIK